MKTKNHTLTPAPMEKRVIAFLIDSLVLLFFMLWTQFKIPYVLPFAVWYFYKAVSEASTAQATPGKRAMGLIVVRRDGDRLSLGASLLRTALAFFSGFTFFLVYCIAWFTPKNQTLHDLIADTLVVEGTLKGDFAQAWADEVRRVGQILRDSFNRLRQR